MRNSRPPLVEFIAGCICSLCVLVFFVVAMISDVIPDPLMTCLLVGSMMIGFISAGVIIAHRVWTGRI